MKNKIIFGLLVIVSIFAISGCSSKDTSKERTIEYLLDRYVDIYSKADMSAIEDMFPPFYVEYSKDYITKEKLEKDRNKAKEVYGDDFEVTYKVGNSVKMTDDELEKLNNDMINNYNAKEKATECYKYEVSIIFKGSKKEDPDAMTTMGYCKYNDTWYLVKV